MDNKGVFQLRTIGLGLRMLASLIFSFVMVIFVAKFYSNGETVKKDASLDRFTAHLNRRIPALMKDYDIPGVAIALVQEGKTIWSKAYGYAHRESNRKMTIDTKCRVESISKSVTAWGVMKLVEQGKIDLDSSVVQYLDDWEFPPSKFSTKKVTIRQLLSHNAGMPLGNFSERYSLKEDIPSLEESLLKEAILVKEPGSFFSYSNVGFNLLELVIEKVTGRDFAEYMKEEVLLPLGMEEADFIWREDWEPPVPYGYTLKGNPVPVYIYPCKASGGLFANVEDISTFITTGMTGFSPKHEVLTDQSIDKLYTPNVKISGFYGLAFDAYGLGHFIETFPDGKRGLSHGGQGYGWMTHFHSVPETGAGIVILTNSQRSWPFFAYILRDWAKWNGFGPIGMGRILWGQKIIWTLTCLVFLVIIRQGWRLGLGLILGRRRFSPLAKKSLGLRLAQSCLAVLILSNLWWCLNQEYLFLSSVFPIASPWLGWVAFLFALILLLSAFFPELKQPQK